MIAENIEFSHSVHSFIKKKSIFTAQKSLKTAIKGGILEYYKMDIKNFYDSIDKNVLLKKLEQIIDDKRFINLVHLLIDCHTKGISTGSCLSPMLSNVYLMDFDDKIENDSIFYSRYVDDILIAPKRDRNMFTIVDDTKEALADLQLQTNIDKSLIVNANDGFRYLGFDIKSANAVDELITRKNYVLADQILNQKTERNEETVYDFDFETYKKLFVRDTTRCYVTEDAQNRFIEHDYCLDAKQLNCLINEHKEFAVPALDLTGLCSYAVFDIDINREVMLQQGDDSEIFTGLLKKAYAVAEEICIKLHEIDIYGYIEFSGYKGYHVWVFWQNAITLVQQKIFFKNFLLNIEVPPGIHIEKFPINHDNQKIKLPLSFHAIHGEQAIFISGVQNQSEIIKQIKQSHYVDLLEKEKIILPLDSRYEPPAHIVAIYNKCHIVKKIIDKAIKEEYINYHERITLLHIFHCLGEDGEKYLHYVMSHCINYDYAVTQKYINKCNCPYPIGCKKLAERFEDLYGTSECTCNFQHKGMYPSPIIYAKMITPSCFNLPEREDHLGHFRQKPMKQRTDDVLERLIDLNKKEYELHSQQKICNSQIETLFKENELTEIQTSHGLLIKTEQGLFIKVG